jgi:hypothetical protein
MLAVYQLSLILTRTSFLKDCCVLHVTGSLTICCVKQLKESMRQESRGRNPKAKELQYRCMALFHSGTGNPARWSEILKVCATPDGCEAGDSLGLRRTRADLFSSTRSASCARVPIESSDPGYYEVLPTGGPNAGDAGSSGIRF